MKILFQYVIIYSNQQNKIKDDFLKELKVLEKSLRKDENERRQEMDLFEQWNYDAERRRVSAGKRQGGCLFVFCGLREQEYGIFSQPERKNEIPDKKQLLHWLLWNVQP